MMKNNTLHYFITFACYGHRLHGDTTGSVDRHHNQIGTPLLASNRARLTRERQRMEQPPYVLDAMRRTAVLDAIKEHCSHAGWPLLAAHIRTTHVHIILESETHPNRIMASLKSYASRKLNQLSLDPPTRKRWTRHGSTRWLWKPAERQSAIRYLIEQQGEPMAIFLNPDL